MSLLFLWVPKNKSALQAKQHFLDVLKKHVELLKEGFRREYQIHIHELDEVFIGQIYYDTEVKDWVPWVQHESSGLAWSGICENFLGKDINISEVGHIKKTVSENTKELLNWDGRFGICTWDSREKVVHLATGATETTSFWFTEGPYGWAFGNRALPLLELTGKETTIDLEMATIYAASGYNMGSGSLFKEVSRLPSRRLVKFYPGQKPSIETYLTIDEYFRNCDQEGSFDDAVSKYSERILFRVKRQLSFSSNPLLLLTGGRDSRCIAAAAVKAGYHGKARTSGQIDSEDVVQAKEIAQKLGLQHVNPLSDEFIAAYEKNPRRLDLWMLLTEGFELYDAFTDFFSLNKEIAQDLDQKFHGLGGEIGRGYYYHKSQDLTQIAQVPQVFEILTEKMPSILRLHSSAKKRILDALYDLEQETNGLPMTLAQWLDLYYWQNRCLHWGEDMMAVKDMMEWRWTPLLDKILIQTTWGLDPKRKVSNEFIEAVTLKLQPILWGIEYNKDTRVIPKPSKKIINLVLKGFSRKTTFLQSLISGQSSGKHPKENELLPFLKTTFLDEGSHLWSEIVDPSYLEEVLKKPTTKFTKNLTTVELLKKATEA